MAAPPVEPKIEYAQYAWLSLVAFLGAVARVGRWTDDKGKFMLSKLIQESAGAIVFGQIALAACTYEDWKPLIAGGIAGVAGLFGAAGVTGIIQAVISLRFGGKKDAGDSKAS